MTPFWPISNTALAAALATLGVELDPTQPYSRVIDERTNAETTSFWFRDRSTEDQTRRTEEIIAAWGTREKFEHEFPGHPLVPMRAAHDARAHLVKVVHGTTPLPEVRGQRSEVSADPYVTPHLHEAAILFALKFPLLLFTGRAFSFPSAHNGQAAAHHIEASQKSEGRAAEQWMARFLLNLNDLLRVAKGAVPIIKTVEENRTLLLTADATGKTKDKFFPLL